MFPKLLSPFRPFLPFSGASISDRMTLRALRATPFVLFTLILLWGCGGEDAQLGSGNDDAAHSAHGDHGDPGGRELGEVTFPTSCAEEVQPRFEEGIALLHSFYFTESRNAFEQVAEDDPSCAMAHWGIAMSHRGNPFAGPVPPGGDEAGLAAAERARELGGGTEREDGYVEAVIAFFRDHDSEDYRSRMLRYEEVMDRLRQEHPDDWEATIFFAREVTANASPGDQTFERQMRAAELMEPLFEQHPRHPGLAHYIIHAYDTPQLAERGLAAARAYEEIAPDAPHALHMPSHIYTRLGYWDESIDMNRRSAEAGHPDSPHRLHAWDYKVYGFLQQGRDDAAAAILEEAERFSERVEGGLSYNGAAMPARYALERDRWPEAAVLPVRTAPGTPQEAVTRFARGIGAARTGDVVAASEEAAALARIRDALRDQGEEDWAERTEAQRLTVAAWVAHVQGEVEDALRMAEEAGEIETRVEKHPVTPGPLIPARELHADLLMDLQRYEEALGAYERTLEREPNRARALAGAAQAAELAGEGARAREHYTALLDLMDAADVERPELLRARRYLED